MAFQADRLGCGLTAFIVVSEARSSSQSWGVSKVESTCVDVHVS